MSCFLDVLRHVQTCIQTTFTAARERRRERNQIALQTKKKQAGQKQARADRHNEREAHRKQLREEQMAVSLKKTQCERCSLMVICKLFIQIAEQRRMKPLTPAEQLDVWYAKNVKGRAEELELIEKEMRDEEVWRVLFWRLALEVIP